MTRYSDRQDSLKQLNYIDKNKKDYLIIHYACGNFYEENGLSSTIVCIAVRKLNDGQTTMFTINQIAEIKQIPFDKIDENYKILEKELLSRFFQFVKNNEDKIWIHWNMRDHNYGFKAIEHRYEALKGKPTKINDNNKIDLAWMFIKLFGKNYLPKPKMKNLMEFNNIDQRDFLSGEEEAIAIKKSEYLKINMSTSTKVDLFNHFIDLAIDNNLKTNTSTFELNGTDLKGRWYSLKETKIFPILSNFFNIIIGAIIGILIERYFF